MICQISWTCPKCGTELKTTIHIPARSTEVEVPDSLDLSPMPGSRGEQVAGWTIRLARVLGAAARQLIGEYGRGEQTEAEARGDIDQQRLAEVIGAAVATAVGAQLRALQDGCAIQPDPTYYYSEDMVRYLESVLSKGGTR